MVEPPEVIENQFGVKQTQSDEEVPSPEWEASCIDHEFGKILAAEAQWVFPLSAGRRTMGQGLNPDQSEVLVNDWLRCNH